MKKNHKTTRAISSNHIGPLINSKSKLFYIRDRERESIARSNEKESESICALNNRQLDEGLIDKRPRISTVHYTREEVIKKERGRRCVERRVYVYLI
jgi:hypothetical protein